ncbi:glutamine amidotransferase [soil metagenome]
MTQLILLAGESWVMHTIHQKGFDSFTTTAYGEGHQWLSSALRAAGFEVEHLPNHLANDHFPQTPEALSRYSAVILSDIGANTLLLHSDTFVKSEKRPNRLESIREYVAQGGGLVMIGGYLTFQGIEAKSRYAGTPVETALPVTMLPFDDRVEAPQGVEPVIADPGHPIVAGLAGSCPALLGYNKLLARPGATVIARVNGDPLIAVWEYGQGRSVAFASDCGPHWAPPEFVEWEGYASLWSQLAGWVSGS